MSRPARPSVSLSRSRDARAEARLRAAGRELAGGVLGQPEGSALDELHLPVGLLNPHERFSVALSKVAVFRKSVRDGVLAAAQFPDELEDEHGTITKPADL